MRVGGDDGERHFIYEDSIESRMNLKDIQMQVRAPSRERPRLYAAMVARSSSVLAVSRTVSANGDAAPSTLLPSASACDGEGG